MGLSPAEWDATRLSLVVALTAVLASLPFGVLLAWLLARREFRGKAFVETIVNLPLVLPPVVTGYGLLVLFGSHGPLGRWLESWFGLRLVFDWKGAALASAVVAFPLMVRTIRVAMSSVDPQLEAMARTLGARRWDCFFTVTLPLARHGIVAGAVIAFARALGEFGATIMVAGSIPGETRTIPLYIYNAIESPGGEQAALRVIVVSVVVSLAALLASEWYLQRERRLLGKESGWA